MINGDRVITNDPRRWNGATWRGEVIAMSQNGQYAVIRRDGGATRTYPAHLFTVIA